MQLLSSVFSKISEPVLCSYCQDWIDAEVDHIIADYSHGKDTYIIHYHLHCNDSINRNNLFTNIRQNNGL